MAAQLVKNPPATAGDARLGFHSSDRKIPWRMKWQPTPMSLLGESHGHGPGGLQSMGLQSDATEHTRTHIIYKEEK